MTDDPLECCFNLDGIGDGWFQCGVCGRCERRFKNTGEAYSGWGAASDWLYERGYWHGVARGEAPVAICLTPTIWAVNWRVMTPEQREALDGVITWGGGDPRTADALVTLKEAP